MRRIINKLRNLLSDKTELRRRANQDQKRYNNAKNNQSDELMIKVVGTTFCNEDGELRQKILQELKAKGSQLTNVEMQKYSYLGEPAIRIMAGGKVIGNVAKDQVSWVSDCMCEFIPSHVVVVGGGVDSNGKRKFFGARLYMQRSITMWLRSN